MVGMVESVQLRPRQGQFNTVQIEKYLESLPATFRDPVDQQGPYFLVGGEEETSYAEYLRANRLEEPTEPYPYVCMAWVTPEQIEVLNAGEVASLEAACQFVEWVVRHYECQILDQSGNDVTDQCRDSVRGLFGLVEPGEEEEGEEEA